MEIKYIFSMWLAINCVYALSFAGRYLFEKKPKNSLTFQIELLCLASAIWSGGFSFMYAQSTEHGAYICRSIAIFGTFLYMIYAQITFCKLSGIKKRLQLYFNIFACLGIPLYIATIQPSQTSYISTPYGMTYQFTPGIVSTLYNAYFALTSLNILIVTLLMLRKHNPRRIRSFGKYFLVVEIFVIGGSVLDMVLPALGTPALPGSNVTQFWGLIVVWFAVHSDNHTRVTTSNMSEYIYDSLNIPVLVFDSDRLLRIMNDSATSFLNIDATLPEEEDLTLDEYFTVKEDFFDFEGNSQTVNASCLNNKVECELNVSKIIDKFSDVIGYIIIVNDITEHINAVNTLAEAKWEADNANRAKSEFLSNMSHEIRTPLNAIVGFSDMALKDNINDVARDYFKDIKIASDNLLTIINDVLHISRIDAGRAQLVVEDYDAGKLFNDINLLISSQAKYRGLKYITDISPSIPNGLRGDKNKLQEIIVNFLSNSLKFTEAGSVTLKVTNEPVDEKNVALTIAVTDTGVGMPKEELDKLFDKYTNMDLSSSLFSDKVAGLGLTIAKRLIDVLGGTLNAESTIGVGTTFTIKVVQEVVDVTPIQLYVPKLEKSETPKALHFKGVKFLAVDDNKVNLKVISKIMDRYGIAYDLANSGAEAVELCKQNNYDVILMDQMMPEMDGVQAMHLIRQQEGPFDTNSTTIIMALTANVVDGVKEQLLGEGFDEYLGKPINIPSFEKALTDHVNKDKYYYQEVSKEQ